MENSNKKNSKHPNYYPKEVWQGNQKAMGNRIQIRYLVWQTSALEGKAVSKQTSASKRQSASKRNYDRESGEKVTIGEYEIAPVYFQWDARDKKILKYVREEKEAYERCENQDGNPIRAGKRIRKFLYKMFQKLAVVYFRRRYRGVFLENTETLFLSEKSEKEIPDFLWKSKPRETEELHWSYAKETFWEILGQADIRKTVNTVDIVHRTTIENATNIGGGEVKRLETAITLAFALPEEASPAIFEEWLEEIWENQRVQSKIEDFILIGSSQQQEACEEILDFFYEQTGIAGSFYDGLKQYKREMAERVYTDEQPKRKVLFLDCLGVPVKEIGRTAFYIDGTGLKTKGEIRKMVSAGIICKSLRKYLDSIF